MAYIARDWTKHNPGFPDTFAAHINELEQAVAAASTGSAGAPADGSVTDVKVAAGAAIQESKLSLASDAAAGTASRRTLGTGATQATAGNDARLSDTRTPSAGSIVNSMVSASAAIAPTKLSLGGGTTNFLRADGTWAPPAGGGSGSYPATALVAFVDYANGSDSNSGRDPSSAYKTIQAAYDALRTYANANFSDLGKGLGVGTILLFPGRHDVGAAGLAFDSNRPVAMQPLFNTRGGSVTHFPSNTAAKIVSSSGAITQMVKLSHASAIGYGFEFRNIAFEIDQAVNTALTKVIWASKIGDLVVDHCSASTSDNATNQSATFLYHEDITTSSGEAGWVRLTDCNVSRFQLYQAATTTGAAGGNFNRGRISNNVCFYGGSLPMLSFSANVNSYVVDGNNLEGTAVAVDIGGNGIYTQNTFINNSGEDPSSGTPANPFYNFSGSVSQQIIIGGTCSAPSASGAGKWVNFGANAYRNYVLGVFDSTAITTDHKRYVSETSNSEKNSLIPVNFTQQAYTVTNPTTDRALNVTADTTAQVAQVLGTLLADLQTRLTLR